jgi:serine/threonine protein kinase
MSEPGYELLDVIGRSGMNTVYRARDVRSGREVAIKTLHVPSAGPDWLFREAQLTAQLAHPGIVPVYASGLLPDGRPFLAMKLVKGDTLNQLLGDRGAPADELPRFVAVFERACQTLAFVHAREVIHRNLKPSKVMIGAPDEVLVLGWGLARGTTEPDSSNVAGTPGYMPPEQARGARADQRSDVFGLGGILCAILTGEPVFAAGPSLIDTLQRSATGDVADAFVRLDTCGADAELIALAKRCLAPNPANRPASANEVASAVTAHRRRARR